MANKQKFDSQSGLLDIHTTRKYVETVVDNAGLQVRFDPNIPTPMTNKNVLLIPQLNGNVTHTDLKKLRWWVLHECLHHVKGPDAFAISNKELGFDARHSPLAAIWNIFEDERIEKAGALDYKGDKIIINDGWETLTNEQHDDLKNTIENANEDMQKLGAAWYLNLKARSYWSPAALAAEAQFSKLMSQEIKDNIKKLEDAGILEELCDLRLDKKGSRQSLNLSKKTYEILWEKNPDEHIKETKEQRKKEEAEGQGGGEAGKGTKGEGGEADKSAATMGNGDGKETLNPTGGKVSYKVFVHSEHTPKAPGVGGTGIQLDYTEYKKSASRFSGTYNPSDNIKVINYRTKYYSDNNLKQHEASNYYITENKEREIISHHRTEGIPGKGFGNKIRQLLQVKSQAHYQGGKKKGKLHFKNVYKAGIPIDSINERVFRQKTESDTLDTTVTVLTDLSGSMNGQKFLNAVDSSILLNTSIARSLRIPVEMLAFTEYGPDTFIGIIKEADEPSSDEKIIENFSKAACFMSANADGDAILWAYERLKTKKQKRKIMIVISDGSPAASRPGDCYEFTCKVVKQIEGEKLCDIYAVGIMNDNVKDIYSESVVINRPSELEHAVLNLIKRSIF